MILVGAGYPSIVLSESLESRKFSKDSNVIHSVVLCSSIDVVLISTTFGFKKSHLSSHSVSKVGVGSSQIFRILAYRFWGCKDCL